MKLGIKVALAVAVMLVLIVIGNVGLDLVNQPDDMSVIVGFGILLVILVFLVAVGQRLVVWVKKQFKEEGE